jgi:hypothetical protein
VFVLTNLKQLKSQSSVRLHQQAIKYLRHLLFLWKNLEQVNTLAAKPRPANLWESVQQCADTIGVVKADGSQAFQVMPREIVLCSGPCDHDRA